MLTECQEKERGAQIALELEDDVTYRMAEEAIEHFVERDDVFYVDDAAWKPGL